VRPRRRSTPRHPYVVAAWIRREFAVRGLVPPHCTPEALARALEQERQITIVFQPHASDDPGVYGLLYHPPGRADTYIICFRPTPSLVLRRLIVFHELAHILFDHPCPHGAGKGGLRGARGVDEEDARAEAFAVGAMQYSFLDVDVPTAPAAAEEDSAVSAFGQFLQRTQYQP
jgi:hypothetical protein